MAATPVDPFSARATFETGSGPATLYRLRALDDAGVKFTYLEYGSYVSQWKQRLALKLWAGFPTFPMVFVDGSLVGGHAQLVALLASGGLKA